MKTRSWPLIGMTVILAVICAVFLLRAAVSAGDRVPYAMDFNEGWNAYHAEAALGGGALYPSPPSFMYNNYPPLSFYAVGLAGKFLGDAIMAGRILSVIAALMTALFIAGAARRMGCSWLEGAWGALLFLTLLLMDYDYVGMNDPQLMGHAFAMAGCVLVLARRGASLWVGSLLLAIGFFIKTNLIILPLAMSAWLFFYDRRNAIRLALAGLGWLLAGLAAFQLFYGKSLWSQINAPRSYDLAAAFRGLEGWLELGAIPLLAAAALVFMFPKDRHVLFCVLYLGLALLIGTIFYGGAGVAGNVFFDALIALGLCASVGIHHLAADERKSLIFAGCNFVPLMAGLCYLLATDSVYPRYWLEPRAPARLLAAQDIAFLKAQDGPVMCALLSLCYWAGKPAEMDIGLTGQALLKGQRDAREAAQLFAQGAFAAVQMVQRPQPGFEPGSAINQAIATHYRLDHEDMYGRFYVRQGQPR